MCIKAPSKNILASWNELELVRVGQRNQANIKREAYTRRQKYGGYQRGTGQKEGEGKGYQIYGDGGKVDLGGEHAIQYIDDVLQFLYT